MSIDANVDEETGVDAGAARILPSLDTTAFRYSGVLKTTEAAKVPGDQPDYDEPSKTTRTRLDVDESERD